LLVFHPDLVKSETEKKTIIRWCATSGTPCICVRMCLPHRSCN